MRFQRTIISKIFILMMIIILAGFGCKDELTVVPIKTIFLKGEDVGVTDALLHITITNDKTPSNFSLKLDGRTIFTGSTRDTMILSDVLLPKHTYTYKAYRLNGTQAFDSSDVLIITTMDTTSHNFTWEIDTLGDGNSSVLYDVAILSDTLAFAVGEIYYKDSLGQFGPMYNVVSWDGVKWIRMRVSVQLDYSTSVIITDQDPITSVFVSTPNDIWFVSRAGGVTRFVSGQWQMMNIPYPQGPAGTNKMWGTSSNNMYFVASGGRITHYNGTSWQKMESGTDVNLTDVGGNSDGSIVWACGYNENNAKTCLLRNTNNSWSIAYDGTNTRGLIRRDSLSGSFVGIYVPIKTKMYLCSSAGVYETPNNTSGNGKRLSFTDTWFPGYPRGIRGNDRNDFTIAGDFRMVAHYNGVTWRYYSELRTTDMHFNAISQRGNFIVGVGIMPDPIHSRGFVARGKR